MPILKAVKGKLPTIGWREWVALPDFGIERIKVKVDTGARSSSLHAFDVKIFERDGKQWVRFQVHPEQRDDRTVVEVDAPVLEFRSVRSSSGKAAVRPVIVTHISLLGITWPIELTLASRDKMGFRMLLGREAFRGRFLVDAGKSYFGGKPARPKRRPKRERSTKVKTAKTQSAKILSAKVQPSITHSTVQTTKIKSAKGQTANPKTLKNSHEEGKKGRSTKDSPVSGEEL